MPHFRAIAAAVPLLVAGSACADQIGDECVVATDCSSAGDRFCDTTQGSPGGYCTIMGCDFDTCPDEAVCVRFFSVAATNRTCDPGSNRNMNGQYDCTEDGLHCCTADELCTLGETCVPRTAEIRFCMRKCGNDGDCRDGYECRTEELMMRHGGEPVPPPEPVSGPLQPFCAAAPPSPS
jgi:hypothetical protein